MILLFVVAPVSTQSTEAFSVFGFTFGDQSTQASTGRGDATGTTTSLPSPILNDTNDTHPCLQVTNHEYEVCTAYIANSSLAVLVPYYKYAHSSNATLQRYVTYRLSSRYTGNAYNLIVSRVGSWAPGEYDVEAPHIAITSVNSSLPTNTATLVTHESWTVTDRYGRIVYQENNAQHVITMQRVPSYILHKWVVTSIQ